MFIGDNMLITTVKTYQLFYVQIWYLHILIILFSKDRNYGNSIKSYSYNDKQHNLMTYKKNTIKTDDFHMINTLNGFLCINIL